MTEILYSPKHNELFLFTGQYEFNPNDQTMTLYLITKRRKSVLPSTLVKIEAKDLIHVGWL